MAFNAKRELHHHTPSNTFRGYGKGIDIPVSWFDGHLLTDKLSTLLENEVTSFRLVAISST